MPRAAFLLAAVLLGPWAPAALANTPLLDSTPPPTEADGYFEVVSRVTDRVHLIANPTAFHVQPVGNVTVIEQSDGLVLVDSGGSPGSGRRVVALVRGISPKPVKAVILTHWHGDHPYGLQSVLEAWPDARVISTQTTRDGLITGGGKSVPTVYDPEKDARLQVRIDAALPGFVDSARDAKTPQERAGYESTVRTIAQFGRDLRGVRTVEPTVTFTDRYAIADPEAPVEARFLGRANTSGDAVVWLPRQKVLVTGDIVVAPIPFGFGSHVREWLGVLDKLRAYPFVALIPGHGAVQRDRTYLDRLTGLMRAVRARVDPLAEQGLSLPSVQARVNLDDHAALFVGDDPWMRYWFKASWSDPIIEGEWNAARARRKP